MNAAETTVSKRKSRVLLCTGEQSALILKRMLDAHGFETLFCAPKADAILQHLAKTPFRLMVLEDSTPPNAGYELLARIRENPLNRRIPTIMLVANAQVAEQARKLGVDECLIKPFSPAVFIPHARHLLTRGLRPSNILLADPDVPTLITAGTTLHQNTDLRVFLACTVADTLDRLKSETPDIMILDPHLPDINAEDFFRQVTQRIALTPTRLILAAAAHEVEYMRDLGGAEIRGVLTKPFKLQTLVTDLCHTLAIKLQPRQPARATDQPLGSTIMWAHLVTKPERADEEHLNSEIKRLLLSARKTK